MRFGSGRQNDRLHDFGSFASVATKNPRDKPYSRGELHTLGLGRRGLAQLGRSNE